MAVKVRPTNDAYTVLLSISLIAMIVSCVLLYYDVKRYPQITPPASLSAPARTGGPATGTPGT
jgi:hypothetical protein